jgi:hypothetical protein
MEAVESFEFCGMSGKHCGCNWYNVTTKDGEEYSVYLYK